MSPSRKELTMEQNTNDRHDGVIMLVIDDDRLRLYQEHAQAKTLRQAVRRLNAVARDLEALKRMGEVEAVAGATVLLREAVLDVMSVPAGDFAEHEKKCNAVHAHFAMLDPPWLVEAALGLAVQVEWNLIEVTPEQERRLRATMPRSRIGSK